MYLVIVAGSILLIHRIWREPSLQSVMYLLIAQLFFINISCTTAIVPNAIFGLWLGMDHISLGGCLFQMFFIYTMIMFESDILILMALDRYVAICKPLRYHDIVTNHFLVRVSIACLVKCCLVVSVVIILASKVHFCRSNVILHFACENMVLLRLSCDSIARIQLVGLIIRVTLTATNSSVFCFSYIRILYTAMNIVTGKARRKTLDTCGTQIFILLIKYSCGLFTTISYRTHGSPDIQNFSSAFYYIFPCTVHPLIYGYRISEIRKCLAKAWRPSRI
ncbi:olfactory receptor 52N5-like [Gastrophryne carolinensis]